MNAKKEMLEQCGKLASLCQNTLHLPLKNKLKKATRLTRYVDLMLFLCWPSVVDDGPTLKQHWLNDLCLLGKYI